MTVRKDFLLRAAAGLVPFIMLKAVALAQETPSLNLEHVRQSPVIDGDLSDTCWQACRPVSFVRFPNGEQPTWPTAVRVITDGTWLFVAYDCEDPRLKAADDVAHRVDTPLPGADAVELFVDPGTEGRLYYHFATDRFGQQYDQRGVYNEFTNSYQKDTYYNAHWRAAGRPTAQGWSAEMAIPIVYFIREQIEGAAWRVNFCRHEKDTEKDFRQWSCWSLTSDTFHSPAEFGRLLGTTGLVPKPVFMPVLYGARIGVVSALGGDSEYPVLVRIQNESDIGGSIHLQVRNLATETASAAHDRDVAIGARFDETLDIDMVAPFETAPDPEVLLTMQDELGKWQATMSTPMGRFQADPETLDAYLGRSYYTTEPEANLYYTVLRSDQEIVRLRIRVTVTASGKGDGDLLCKAPEGPFRQKIPVPFSARAIVFDKTFSTLSPDEQRLAIPLDELMAGTYTARLQVVSQNGEALDDCELLLVKRQPLEAGTEVKVDRYNRCLLVDDQPFFPFGPVSLSHPKDIPWMARVGFNTYFRWGGSYAYDQLLQQGVRGKEAAERDETLQLCQEHDIMVIDRFRSYTGMTGYRQFRNLRSRERGEPTEVFDRWFGMLEDLVPHVKHHPALLGYCPFDEPKDIFVAEKPYAQLSQEVARAFDQLDGYHPHFNNFHFPVPLESRWKDHQDLYSYYDYWMGPNKGGEVTSYRTRLCSARAKKAHKPLFVMPQSGELSGVPLSPQEQRANTYTMLVGGARGLYYFTWPITHRATYEVMQSLAAEVRTLAPALARRRPRQEIVTVGAPDENRAIDAALLVTPDEELILLVVNRSYRSVDVVYHFDWLDNGATLERMFGSETSLPVSDQRASEYLDKLQTRVYRISGYRRADLKQTYRVAIEEKPIEPALIRNVIVNSGFETDAGWQIEGKRATYDSSISRGGKRTLRLERKKDETMLVVSGEPVQLERGHRYRMEGFIRLRVEQLGEGRASAMFMIAMPKGSANMYAAGGTNESSQQWLRIERELDIVEDVNAAPQIRVRNLVGTAWVDDFSLTDLGVPQPPPADSKNLVPNSSFEQTKLPGWPVRWRQSSYFDFEGKLIGSKDAAWGLDDRFAVHGRYSLRMTGSDSVNLTRSWYQRYNAGIHVLDGQSYTLSLYMRSDTPGARMNVDVREIGNGDFTLTADWKRYTMSGDFKETSLNNSTTAINIGMKTRDPTVHVWIDAVQLEQSRQATEYMLDGYRISPP